MTGRLILALSFVGMAFTMAGCGTFANTCWFTEDEGGMRVYGGVRADWAVACESVAAEGHPENSPGPVWLPIVDMPFSVVGDTITLPITIPMSVWQALNPKHHYSDRGPPKVDAGS
jgi:uncharacterized protein YceK